VNTDDEGFDGLATRIATLLQAEPKLARIFSEAMDRVTRGEMSPQSFRDLAEYASFRLQIPINVEEPHDREITHRNEIVRFEISMPDSYEIEGGGPPQVGYNLLGPAVPDEDIQNLVDRYYGDSLNVSFGESNASGQYNPWLIGIYGYDIITKNLGGVVSPGGIGDYKLTQRKETLLIDGQSYPLTFTVEQRNNEAVGELAVLYLEKDGVQFMFGYIQREDKPEEYQAYLKDKWPVVRQILETYKHLPEN
jgi:hypothetical protein